MSESSGHPPAHSVGVAPLWAAFAKIGLLGFGGVAPYARHVIVEERRWLDDAAYADLLGLGQILPGANTVNLAVMLGDRFAGLSGALAALAGLFAGPLMVLVTLAMIYDRFAAVPAVSVALHGAGAGAAGLVLGTAIKLARGARMAPVGVGVATVVFVAVGILGVALETAVLILAPVSILAHWLARRS